MSVFHSWRQPNQIWKEKTQSHLNYKNQAADKVMPGMLWMKTNLDQLRSFSVWLAANLDWLLGFLNTGWWLGPARHCCPDATHHLIGFRLNTRKRNRVWHISVLNYLHQAWDFLIKVIFSGERQSYNNPLNQFISYTDPNSTQTQP